MTTKKTFHQSPNGNLKPLPPTEGGVFHQAPKDEGNAIVLRCHQQFLKEKYPPDLLNIEPENIPSQKESTLPTIIFQGLC